MKYSFFILLFFIYLNEFAQDYLVDGSFEDTISCPKPQQMPLKYWYRPITSSSDAYCLCNTNDFIFDVPPYVLITPYHLYCYIGILEGFSNGQPHSYREYVETELLNSLVEGEKYCVSINVITSAKTNYTISNFHIGFRENKTSLNGYNNMIGKVDTFYRFQTDIIKDSVNWTKLELEFTATGKEKYLSIGNFDSLHHVVYHDYDHINNPPYMLSQSYYYFDNITLEKCPLPQEPEVSHFSVYPNPSNGNAISISKYSDTTAVLYLYNSIGQQCSKRELPTGNFQGVVFEHLASGVYIVSYQTVSGYREEKKLVVLK